jgi:hypothetical protein
MTLQECSRGWASLLLAHTVTSSGRRARARGHPGICMLVVLLLVPAVVRAQPMNWQGAVAALAAARERAETCVRVLKRHAGSDADALSRGELTYGDAKAEVDAIIRGLIVVLAQGGTPAGLADLEARLTRAVQAREVFCTQATALVPEDPGTRDLIRLIRLGGAVLPLLLEAVRMLYTVQTEQDLPLRRTIQTQLEATQWKAFADITP